jgi:hypothetical protein
MRLAPDFAKTVRGEIPVVVWQRHPHSKGEGACAGTASVALCLREKAPRDSIPAELRVHREAPEIEALTLPCCEHATHEPAYGNRDEDSVVGESRSDRLSGLAERARLGLEPAAIFLEGRADKVGDRGAFRPGREPDRDVASRRAQTVRSGR